MAVIAQSEKLLDIIAFGECEVHRTISKIFQFSLVKGSNSRHVNESIDEYDGSYWIFIDHGTDQFNQECI